MQNHACQKEEILQLIELFRLKTERERQDISTNRETHSQPTKQSTLPDLRLIDGMSQGTIAQPLFDMTTDTISHASVAKNNALVHYRTPADKQVEAGPERTRIKNRIKRNERLLQREQSVLTAMDSPQHSKFRPSSAKRPSPTLRQPVRRKKQTAPMSSSVTQGPRKKSEDTIINHEMPPSKAASNRPGNGTTDSPPRRRRPTFTPPRESPAAKQGRPCPPPAIRRPRGFRQDDSEEELNIIVKGLLLYFCLQCLI